MRTSRATAPGLIVGLLAALLFPVAASPSPSVASARADGGSISVAAGGEHSCEVRSDGALWCWGRNSYGQLGQGTTGVGSPTPVQVGQGTKWRSVSAGASSTCAIKTTGSLYCWGVNQRGQLGVGTRDVKTKPARVGKEKSWTSVSLGYFHTCATRDDQTLWCWGDNSAGELGIGSTKPRSEPIRLKGHSWASVATGGWHTCATKTDGSLWCWGRNTFGQLGTGSYADTQKPVHVGTGVGWRQLAASFTHTCGVRATGEVRCWGRNTTGQLGAGTEGSTQPVVVPGVTGAVSVIVTEGSSCALDGAGTARCWGANQYGQLGTATSGSPSRAKQVAGVFSRFAGGWLHVCASSATATRCWGNNEWGQLGTGSPSARARRTVPVAATAHDRASAKASSEPFAFGLATFNVLGNNHSRPYAHDDRFASSRIRAEWTYQAIKALGADVVALQETSASQLAAIMRTGNGEFAGYRDPADGDLSVESALIWNTNVFEAVKKTSLKTQFIRRVLPRPVVKLRHKATGRTIWVMGVHNAPWEYQEKRNQAVKVQIEKLQQLEEGSSPVFYLGDMNEKKTILCKVLKKTMMHSPAGGRLVGGKCQPPAHTMRVDWIFGPKTVTWSGFTNSKDPLVRLSTDHWVPVVRVNVPS